MHRLLLRLLNPLLILIIGLIFSTTRVEAAPAVVVIDKTILTIPDDVLEACLKLSTSQDIKVIPVDPAPILRNDESVRQLSTDKSSTNQHTLGVTRSSYRISFKYALNSIPVKGTKGTCSVPSIQVNLEQVGHEVSIGKEFSPNSCLFNHIRHHEYVHVAINKKGIYDSTAQMTKELQSQFENKVFVGSAETLAKMLDESMRGYWSKRASQLHADVMKLHKVLDSPQEYAKNNTVCNGALKSVLKSAGY